MDILKEDIEIQHTVWGFAGTFLWALLIYLVAALISLLTIGVYVGFVYGRVSGLELQQLMLEHQFNGYILSIIEFVTLVVCGGMVVGVVKLKKGSDLKDYLGLKVFPFKVLKYWLVVLVAYIVLSDLVTMLIGRSVVSEFMTKTYLSMEFPWMMWVALMLAAPIFEEVFFRGFLMSGLKSSFVGPVGAVLISSFLWSITHTQYDIYYLILIFVMGLGFGVARLKTDSVLLTICLHSFANLVATIETVISVSS